MQLTIKMREAIAQLPREFGYSLKIGRQMGRLTYKVTHENVTVYDATLTNCSTGNVWHCQYESNDDPEGRDWVGDSTGDAGFSIVVDDDGSIFIIG